MHAVRDGWSSCRDVESCIAWCGVDPASPESEKTPEQRPFIVSFHPDTALCPMAIGNEMASFSPRDQFRINCLGVGCAVAIGTTVLGGVVSSHLPFVATILNK
jgi:hypothetical protein